MPIKDRDTVSVSLRYIGLLALVVGLIAHVPSITCSSDCDDATIVSCCVPADAGNSDCCGTMAVCEFAMNANDLDPATTVASEYPVGTGTSENPRAAHSLSSTIAVSPVDASDHIPRSLTCLRTTFLLL
jgi:hypothetical protein